MNLSCNHPRAVYPGHHPRAALIIKVMAILETFVFPCVEFVCMTSPATLLLVTLTLACVLVYSRYTNEVKVVEKDWSRLGVKFPTLPRNFFSGSNPRKQMATLLEQYGNIVGLKFRNEMWLLTTNLDLLRTVLIKDFNNFTDRANDLNSNSPLAKGLFFAKGNEWRRHRQIVSPTFTSGKLKQMSKPVEESARKLANYLADYAIKGKVVPIKDTSAKYSCEVIAKIAFGLNASVIKDENSEFFEHGKKLIILFHEGVSNFLLMWLNRIPGLVHRLNKIFPSVQLFDAVNLEANLYFKQVLANTIAERRAQMKRGENRKSDFLDLLLKAGGPVESETIKTGTLEMDGELDEQIPAETTLVAPGALSDEEILGHSMLVIFAGLETTATTLQMCLYELARHQDIQEKVYQEIQEVLDSEEITVDHLNQLRYTEWVVSETLRLHPPIPTINRQARDTRTYSGVTIPQGALVMIPLWHILMDPNIWPDPDRFDPDRFSPGEKDKRDPMAFVSFGQGPQLCLGMRLAYLELKMALAHVMRKVKVVLNDQTEPRKGATVEVKKAGLLAPVKPVMLAFELRP